MKRGKLGIVPPRPAAKTVTPARIGKKGVLTQLDQDTARRLKMLAVQHDTTLQALGEEAFEALLERYGG